MPKGGTFIIETSNVHLDEDYAARDVEATAGDYVLLPASDCGTGMPPEVLDRVFEPFFTTKEPGKGTRLGLGMVYGFVKQSNGHMKIYSEVGHGMTVKIYLPRASAAHAPEPARERQKPDRSQRQELILVVDDNEPMRKIAATLLVDLRYRVLETSRAKAALDIFDDRPDIDLLFSDVIMPGGMSGFDLAREASAQHPKLRILLTSGYTAKTMTSEFHDIGGAELLHKPYRKHDLALKLRQLEN